MAAAQIDIIFRVPDKQCWQFLQVGLLLVLSLPLLMMHRSALGFSFLHAPVAGMFLIDATIVPCTRPGCLALPMAEGVAHV